MNKVILSGRIASEIELKATPSGVSVCSFRIAVSRKFKNAEGNYDADFISCVAWRANADFINKYFSKGDPIELCGNIQTRTYEDNGKKMYVTEVIVDEVGFTQGKKEKSQEVQNIPSAPTYADGFMPLTQEEDDDLPF